MTTATVSRRASTSSGPSTPIQRAGASLYSRRAAVLAGQIGVWVVLIGGWQLLASASDGLTGLVGSPSGVIQSAQELFGDGGWSAVWTTLRTAFIGYLLGVALACVATAVLVPSRLVMEFLDPVLMVLNAIPRVSIAPIFILWLGIGIKAGIAFVVTTIFLIVFLNLYAGIRSIDPVYGQNLRCLGAPRLALVRHVYAPSVFGWLMTSLRTSAAWALLAAALAEYMAGNEGLGYLLAKGGTSADPDLVVAAATVIALMALTSSIVLGSVERRFSQWRVTK